MQCDETPFARAKRIYETTFEEAKHGDAEALERLLDAADRMIAAANAERESPEVRAAFADLGTEAGRELLRILGQKGVPQ